MTPTKEDMARDLAADLIRLGDDHRNVGEYDTWVRAVAAIRRALAAEALLRRFLAATGSFGSRELASVTEDARELLGEVSP